MPSGWTESGIDWGNLQNYSPRDVIRELYIAVSERNYWIKYFATGGYNDINSLESIDYDATNLHRTKDQLNFIMTTLVKWLKPTTDFRESSRPISDVANLYGGCFIDYASGSNYVFNKYGRESELDRSIYREYNGHEELCLGYNTYSYDEGGNTETLIDSDLSFIRDYQSSDSFRFTYEMMKSVYDILNTLNYVRCAVYSRIRSYNNYSDTFATLYALTSYFSDSNGSYGAGFVQGDYNAKDADFSVARSDFYETLNGSNFNHDGADAFGFEGIDTIVSTSPILIERLWVGYNRFFLRTARNSYLRFSNTGYNDQLFTTEDFDLKSLSYGISFKEDGIGNIGEVVISPADYSLSSRPSGHNVIDNKISTLTNVNDSQKNINLNFQGKYWNLSYGNVVDGDIPNSVEFTPPVNGNIKGKFVTQYLPLINFNKEGFLKYYTEPTN